jgi:hypothetical protein
VRDISSFSSEITILVPCEENHFPGSDLNMEVGAVPPGVLGYDLYDTNEVDVTEVDESLNNNKGSPLVCQIALRKILLNDGGLTLSILVCHIYFYFQ